LKNLFLFAPLVFSQHLFDVTYLATSVWAFAVFCLISSLVYVVNDIGDREIDRLHPTKKRRPVAAGTLSVAEALWVAFILLLFVVAMTQGMDTRFQLVALGYLVMNVAYTFSLKHVALLEVFLVAAGFMLRVVAGAYAIDTVVSHWLILCTLFVSLFLAVSKRRGELVLSKAQQGYEGRSVLVHYELVAIDQIMTVAAAGMAISYALYTVSDRTVHMFGTESLIFTTVFVLFGIFRYFLLVRRNETEDNPVRLLLSDGAMMVNVLAWLLSCVVIIYWDSIKSWLMAA
jgi:4-hydroxybenzoate polyprenyltransferase